MSAFKATISRFDASGQIVNLEELLLYTKRYNSYSAFKLVRKAIFFDFNRVILRHKSRKQLKCLQRLLGFFHNGLCNLIIGNLRGLGLVL